MRLLQDKIRACGKVFPGGVLKVDGFLNHQIDARLMREIGKEIARLYAQEEITKVLTIEASGIAIAVMAAAELDVPMLFAKKSQTKNLSSDVYRTTVTSFTHGVDYDVRVAKEFLHSDDRVLIVDDFLANGAALLGLADLVKQSGAYLVGAAIAIEKGFQHGGERVRARGMRVESLAIVEHMDENGIIFRQKA